MQTTRLTSIVVRILKVYCTSVALMTFVGPLSLVSGGLLYSDNMLEARELIGLLLTSSSPLLLLAAIIGALTGLLVSPIVALLVFRRRPLLTLSISYLIVVLYLALVAPWDNAYDMAGRSMAIVVMCSMVAAFGWCVWDCIHGVALLHEFDTSCATQKSCPSCGYIIYAEHVSRCSECGADLQA